MVLGHGSAPVRGALHRDEVLGQTYPHEAIGCPHARRHPLRLRGESVQPADLRPRGQLQQHSLQRQLRRRRPMPDALHQFDDPRISL